MIRAELKAEAIQMEVWEDMEDSLGIPWVHRSQSSVILPKDLLPYLLPQDPLSHSILRQAGREVYRYLHLWT